MDTYICHACGTHHSTGNMTVVCIQCYQSEREVREQLARDVVGLREKKDDLFLSHQIAEVRRENAELRRVVEAARPFASKGCTSNPEWVELHDALAAYKKSLSLTQEGEGAARPKEGGL